jgi:glutamyl-tRNA reductase
MGIVVTGISHRTAPVELRERFAIAPAETGAALARLRAMPGVREAAILSTCNRVELVTVEDRAASRGGADAHPGTASFFARHFGVPETCYVSHLHRLHDEAAVRHLLSVAAGLDSMILGEPQILGQVKEAYHRAREAATAGTLLGRLFERALAAGRRARAETGVGRHSVSVPRAAVRLARTVFRSLEGRTAVLLGRGAMSELAARHLRRAGAARLVAVNRSPETAAEFARRVGAVAATHSQDLAFLDDADLLVCCSRAPYPVITPDALAPAMARRGQRMLLLIDISVPRQIDPAVAQMEQVLLYNIDHLEQIVDDNARQRAAEARKAAAIVEEETAGFRDWMASLDVAPAIRAFRDRLETVRAAEVERALRGMDAVTPAQRARIEEFSRALVNKIAHAPTAALRREPDPDRAARLAEALERMFPEE